MENRRGASQRVVQRQVLYLGEINDSQKAAWCRCIEVFDEPGGRWHPVMLFPEDREAPELGQEAVHVRLHELKVLRPRQWGGCWLSGVLWEQLRAGFRKAIYESKSAPEILAPVEDFFEARLCGAGALAREG